MILYPAIDLKDGQCVRLAKGEMDQATIFNEDPVDQARQFEAAGFEWLHIVDLNGAFAGASVNGPIIEEICKSVSLPIQLGGGIRNMDNAKYWLDCGISRIIIGTAAVKDPDFVHAACKAFPGKVAVGLDARENKVAVEGWAETTELTVFEMAEKFEHAGVAAIIFTDIDRDGVLTGINIESTLALAEHTSIPVIASGGLSSLDDLRKLKSRNSQGIEGVISGRALYDGRLDAHEALALLKGDSGA